METKLKHTGLVNKLLMLLLGKNKKKMFPWIFLVYIALTTLLAAPSLPPLATLVLKNNILVRPLKTNRGSYKLLPKIYL